MTAPEWLAALEERGPWDVALRLGLRASGRHLGPCPACGGDRRSRSDARKGALFLVGKGGWKCGLCGAGGGAAQLAARALCGGEVPGRGGWGPVRDWAEAQGLWAPPGAAGAWRPSMAPPVVRPEPDEAPSRPPRDEVRALWAACHHPAEDAQVSWWLRERHLSPALLGGEPALRALPRAMALPRWARVGGRSWAEGWRAILPAYSASGELVSLRARWTGQGEAPGPKAAAPAAGPRSVVGLVLACQLGAWTLQSGRPPEWWTPGKPMTFVVVEGEPDYLTWYQESYADEDPEAPAVLGIWNGGWTQEIADRLPMGSVVEVRTHDDEAGRRYRDRVAATLVGRATVLIPEGA